MSTIRTLLASVTVALTLCSSARAQSAPSFDKEQDLPIEAPQLQKPVEPPKPPESPPPPPPTAPDGPPPTIYGKDLITESASLIYVLDISLSMSWDPGTYSAPDGSVKTGARIDRARAQLALSIRALPKNFKFNVLAYDCLMYGWQQAMQPASDANKTSAINWVSGLTPESATGTGPAVVLALQERSNKLVVLLTDGAPNCGAGSESEFDPACLQAHLNMIRAANAQSATINVFGIGALGTFRQFCISLASQNSGSYTDVK